MITPSGQHLVFLIGAPRSGTTLLSLILGKASGVVCPPELWLALPVTSIFREPHGLRDGDSDAVLARLALSRALGEEGLRTVVGEFLQHAYNRVLKTEPGKRLLIDKTPRYFKIADVLARLLPDAKFILLSRDPLDIAASHKRRWDIDLSSLTSAAGLCDASYDVLCAPGMIADLRESLAAKAHWLRYEDLVATPDDAVREVCAFLGVPYHDDLLAYRKAHPAEAAFRESPLGDRQVWEREEVDQSSVGSWRTHLSDDETRLIRATVGRRVFERLGYECPPVAEDSAAQNFLEESLRNSLVGVPHLEGDEALLARIRSLEIAVSEAGERALQGEAAAARISGQRLLEEEGKRHWEALYREAEGQRDRERVLREREASEKDHWRTLHDAEAAEKERWHRLYGESEQQRDAENDLRRREASEKEHWQNLYGEAERQRDAESELRQREAADKERWRTLYGEAEGQRDALAESHEKARQTLARLELLWPWIESTEASDTEPRISIVTPSFNQGRWIEATIRSILDQHYPNFEHIVVDAGSSDDTAEVVAKYPHVRFIQEADLGQTHAINKGLMLATGDIVAYLNSDDVYQPGAFRSVVDTLAATEARMLVGSCDVIDEGGAVVDAMPARLDARRELLRYWGWGERYCVPQPGVFLRREVLSEVGLFDISFRYVMDYEMWLRITSTQPYAVIDQTLASFRVHTQSKTINETDGMYLEERRAARRHWPSWWHPSRWTLEIACAHHLAARLLNVAEHGALELTLRRHPAQLLVTAAKCWPPVLFNPRWGLSAATLLSIGTPIAALMAALHRAYLGLVWRVRRNSATAE